jgi:LDH2 family malate/lactate/ureidoglycolate dehydrogenase
MNASASANAMSQSFSIAALERFGGQLLRAAGMDADKAAAQARLLTLTDAMGRRTHGLAMVPLYLAEIEKGNLCCTGEPETVSQRGACLVWDGRHLPGLWLAERAIHTLAPLVADHGMAAVAIRHSHHVGSLGTIEKIAADLGLIALVATSDPAGERMAPFGGTEALFTPNPFGIGYPGAHHPVLVDISSTITTTSMTRQKFANQELFEHPWLLDAQGRPTRDPAVLEHTTPRGSLLPVGGADHGHKGYGMALMVAALTQGLSGHGRLQGSSAWGGNVFIQLLDADFFAGRDAFAAQMDHISARARASRPVRTDTPVRVPGDQAAASLAIAQRDGIAFAIEPWARLATWAAKLQVQMPEAL